MAKIVAPLGVIHAFEPDPENLVRLRRNVALNDFASIVNIHPIALGDIRGSCTFHKAAEGHSGWGSLAKYPDLDTVELTVQADTFDNFCSDHDISRIDFLKVDIEGFEFEFLAGAVRLMRNHALANILIECNAPRLRDRGRTRQELLDYFASFGYLLMGKNRPKSTDPKAVHDLVENLLFTLPAADK